MTIKTIKRESRRYGLDEGPALEHRPFTMGYRCHMHHPGMLSVATSVHAGRTLLLSSTITIAKVGQNRYAGWSGERHLGKHGWAIVFSEGKFRQMGSYTTGGRPGESYFS